MADLHPKDKGITQAELAERLEISQPMASDYERGKLRLHGELIIQLSEILGVSADEILGIKATPQPKGTSRTSIIKLTRDSSKFMMSAH